MRILVFYRRRSGRQRLRIGTHTPPDNADMRQFRLDLIGEYNRTRKRVERIEPRLGGLAEIMETCDRVELMRELKRELIAAMRREEPDYETDIDLPTVEAMIACVDRTIENRIFDEQTA